MSNGEKHAVVLSGGGAAGAYEIGVLKALFNGLSPATGFKPLVPDIITGTSVGSYNAAFLVSQWESYGSASIANLEQVWLDHLSGSAQKCSNGVYRIRANPTEFFNPQCYLPNPFQLFGQMAGDSASLAWDGLQRAVSLATAQNKPLLERVVELFNFSSFVARDALLRVVNETINFADLRRSQKELRIAATNWATGELRFFSNLDMTDQLGPLAIMASSAIPGFFPPTEFGAQPYVDGGVLMNTPLKPAIDAGADVLHVIYMDPDVRDIPLTSLGNTLETVYRMQTIAWAKAVGNDIERARHVNRESGFAQLVLAAMGMLKQNSPDEEVVVDRVPLREIESRLRRSAAYRPLTIHVYHPRDDFGGALGLLNFDRDRIQRLIERGFNDAVVFDSDYDLVRPSSHPILFEGSE